jgi:hypothetical protein
MLVRLASRTASAALAIEQGVIGFAAVIEAVFETHADAIGQSPFGIPEKLVDLDSGKSFIGQTPRAPSTPGRKHLFRIFSVWWPVVGMVSSIS